MEINRPDAPRAAPKGFISSCITLISMYVTRIRTRTCSGEGRKFVLFMSYLSIMWSPEVACFMGHIEKNLMDIFLLLMRHTTHTRRITTYNCAHCCLRVIFSSSAFLALHVVALISPACLLCDALSSEHHLFQGFIKVIDVPSHHLPAARTLG